MEGGNDREVEELELAAGLRPDDEPASRTAIDAGDFQLVTSGYEPSRGLKFAACGVTALPARRCGAVGRGILLDAELAAHLLDALLHDA